jgi:hypothetical protein
MGADLPKGVHYVVGDAQGLCNLTDRQMASIDREIAAMKRGEWNSAVRVGVYREPRAKGKRGR